MSDQQPSMKRTRWMAYIAFLHALYHMTFVDQVVNSVLIFDGSIIAIWALGRSTFIEAIQAWKR